MRTGEKREKMRGGIEKGIQEGKTKNEKGRTGEGRKDEEEIHQTKRERTERTEDKKEKMSLSGRTALTSVLY